MVLGLLRLKLNETGFLFVIYGEILIYSLLKSNLAP
jgi:hypothetical protein